MVRFHPRPPTSARFASFGWQANGSSTVARSAKVDWQAARRLSAVASAKADLNSLGAASADDATPLLMPQRDDWIDSHRSPCGNVGRQQHHSAQ